MLHFSVYTYVAVGAYMSQRRDQNKYALWMCQVSSYVSFLLEMCAVYMVCVQPKDLEFSHSLIL